MKKLLAAAVFALLGTGAFAQTSQGTVEVSGSLGFKSSNREHVTDYKDNSFRIGPSLGYFVADNLAVGLGINYTREASKSTELFYGGYNGPIPVDYKSTTNGYYVNPYITKYFSLTDNIFFTGSGSVDFGKSKTKREYDSDIQGGESDQSTFRAGVTPGISFFPTPKFGLSASFGFLGYSQYKIDYENSQNADYKNSEFGLDFNSSSLNFGFSYFISR